MGEADNSGFLRPATSGARSVLVAVDGSEHSKNAFNHYLKWLVRPDDLVTIYHAIEPVSLPSVSINNLGTVPTDEWSKILQDNLKRVKQLESDYCTDCHAKNLNYQFLYEAVDQTGAAIVSTAEKYQVRLLVVGTRGLSALRRTIMGSVSDYVLHHASTAVCVIPHKTEN
ncbi:uncharacterized protein DEA37_0008534 [Paragonimus westermani]|uniref:UspA domain-containing protein n=1 Tax=Paragonimus westermani TaxID=34504 RepID=A0A5J4NIT1_9TREM|nr:uncharacterized protein DEA37_0008534 [Paragonimus westermani]